MNILYVGNRTLYNDALCELITTRYQQVKLTRVPPPHLDRKVEPEGGQSNWQACFLDLSSMDHDQLDQVRRVRDKLPSGRLVVLHTRRSETLARALEESGADGFLTFDSPPGELDHLLRGPNQD